MASWQYEFVGDAGVAKKAFAQSVPPDYKVLRESDLDVAYAKYDEHDSFYLTFILGRTEPHSTEVMLVLKSIPD